MSITFPTFIDKEIVTPEKLNDFVQALEAKFAAGLGSSDISWPLQAGGDIDLGTNGIVNGRYIWGVYNAAEYEDDFAAALVAGTDGCIFIPPNTTITMDGAAMGGTSLTIIGSGPTSILQLESGASAGYMLRNTNTAFSFVAKNVTFDGASVAASAGLSLRGCSKVDITGCHFQDCALSALKLEFLTQNCLDVNISGNTFSGGSDHHIEGLGIDGCTIQGNIFKSASARAIDIQATSADHYVKDLSITDNVFDNCTGVVIGVLGYNSSFDSTRAHVKVSDNVADNANGIEVGSAAKRLQYVSITDNSIPSSGGNALVVCAKLGKVNGNLATAASTNGLSLLASEQLSVSGNVLRTATATGLSFESALGCNIHDNDCSGSGQEINISTSAATPCHHYGNTAATPEPALLGTWHCTSASFVIPANTLRIGDVLKVHAMWTDGTVGTQSVRLNGVTLGSFTSAGTTDEVGAIINSRITAATSVSSIAMLVADGGTQGSVVGPDNTGLLLTAAQTLAIVGASLTNQEMFVSIERGVSI